LFVRGNVVDEAADLEFRAGLLRHIAMEEKVLLPFARKRRNGEALPIARRIRLDHGALAALLIPTPTPETVRTIRRILSEHNPIEEGAGGLYETCEQLAGADTDELLEDLRSVPEVKLKAHVDSELTLRTTRQAVEMAGYQMDG
jgi:hypothetical protein